ncbi:hypothetical protein HAX54_013828 [Datura stramonium]|uniref:Uncharacterized protein n=1 Tax=Datura stramonium TaxID=4076 RepID=A0ABS8TLY2_DATST|nr:hypothetical protein [Datura stramonium]
MPTPEGDKQDPQISNMRKEKPEAPWANLFTENRFIENSLMLSYIHPDILMAAIYVNFSKIKGKLFWAFGSKGVPDPCEAHLIILETESFVPPLLQAQLELLENSPGLPPAAAAYAADFRRRLRHSSS